MRMIRHTTRSGVERSAAATAEPHHKVPRRLSLRNQLSWQDNSPLVHESYELDGVTAREEGRKRQ